MSGHVGDLSTHQEETLNKFRENVKDVLKPDHDDHFLLRWLRAREFDLQKSEAMLRDLGDGTKNYTCNNCKITPSEGTAAAACELALIWRQQIGADKILEDYVAPDVLDKYRTGGIFGYDKEGAPIYIDPFGLIDLKGLLHCVKKQDMARMFVNEMETIFKMCREESIKRNKAVNEIPGLVLIYDLEKLGLRHAWKPGVDVYLALVEVMEVRYPETLKYVFVINAPKIFPICWSLVRPLLHECTANKVRVLGSNYKDVLLKVIDPDNLPACYGGNQKDPDGNPRCITRIKQGGMVPKELYSQPEPDIRMTAVTVKSSSTLKLEYEIHKPNSLLRWEFLSEGYDIGFGVYRKTADGKQKVGDMAEVLKPQRANSHLVPEDGVVECEKTGTYVVMFDNSYSWARNKKIHYLVEVLEPESKTDTRTDEEFFKANDDHSAHN